MHMLAHCWSVCGGEDEAHTCMCKYTDNGSSCWSVCGGEDEAHTCMLSTLLDCVWR